MNQSVDVEKNILDEQEKLPENPLDSSPDKFSNIQKEINERKKALEQGAAGGTATTPSIKKKAAERYSTSAANENKVKKEQ